MKRNHKSCAPQTRTTREPAFSRSRDPHFFHKLILKELQEMNAEIQALKDEVAKVKTVQQSAITLLQGLSQLIKDAGTDPAELKAITDDLDASSTALADAVTANTPAAPPTGK